VVEHDRGLMIMSVRDDGPAGQAGLRTGDIIIRADSTNLADLTDYQATFLLRGPQDTPLTIKIIRNNMTDTLTFNLIRKQLPLIHIPYAGLTQNKSLYIKIIDFEAGLTDDLKRILDSLYLIDPDNVARIILDLRGNPGGLLREAYRTANCFLDAGHLIVGVKGRSIWRNDEFRSSGHDITANKPIAIIIDKGSASSAEIVAGALKYAGRAILVGDTTFGKGLVQEYTGLGDGSGLRLTTSRYYFEGGIFLNDPEAEVIDSAAGIPPDFYYPFEELEPFPTRLENALLMRDFALENADRIIQYTPFTESEPLWMDEFKTYLKDNGFLYKSTITAIADLAKQLIALGGYQQVYVDAIDRIYQIAQNDDKNQFETYKTYIKQRLYQHALEARFGPMRAYRDAIVPYRGDIHFAETILIEKRNN
jgi:C-terminal peptidase prc